MTEKFCVKCGKKFVATGREVICPSCREAAKAEAKKAAVLRTKRASWTGESVPVRISGRASSVIRAYGTAHNLPFAQALDALLKASDYFKGTGKAWEEVEPYRSHRRDKRTTEAQDVPQEAKQDKPVKTAKKAVKTTSKTVAKATKAAKATSKVSKATDSTALAELFLSGAE